MTRVSSLFSSLSFVRIDLVLTFSRLLSLLLQDIVPAALTKDKKKINDVEIEVSVAWQSTLYVTNFPENSDDASIRELFGQVCPISLSSISARTTLLTFHLLSFAVRNHLRDSLARKEVQGDSKIRLHPVSLAREPISFFSSLFLFETGR